jgi:hypothetical protein
MRTVRASILIVFVVGLGLAACGEKDEPAPAPPIGAGQADAGGTANTGDTGDGDGQSDGNASAPTAEQQIGKATKVVIGGNDPMATCERYATIVYVKHSYGNVKGCRSAVPKQKTFAVDVSGIDVNGDTATAKAKPRGGPNKGETLKVELVREGDAWKVDVVRSTAKVGP